MTTNLVKILSEIDTSEILKAYNSIESDLVWTDYGFKGKQLGLQYLEGEDPWSSGVGRLKREFIKTTKELGYINLNPFFKGTIFEELINKYQMSRTRLIWLGPCAGYTMHRDTTPRIHFPIITNEDNYFFFKGLVPFNMTIGKVYWVDTRHPHCAFNCSATPRLHLIGGVSL